MNKNELSQLNSLNREIELIKRQIEDAELSVSYGATGDTVIGSSTCFPYTQHVIKVTGIDIQGYEKKVNRLKKLLTRRLEELMDKVEEINEFISSVEDSETRIILTLRYINNLSWQQIAFSIGESDESYPRRKHNKFLKAAENAGK